jgi:hypothetical protein
MWYGSRLLREADRVLDNYAEKFRNRVAGRWHIFDPFEVFHFSWKDHPESGLAEPIALMTGRQLQSSEKLFS